MKALNLVGKTFGRLIVLKKLPSKNGRTMYYCKCSCGNTCKVAGGHLRTGHTQSCGCYGREQRLNSITTHGKYYTAEHSSWNMMKDRCYNKRNKRYKRYGGRNIKVCDRWKNSFENFYNDMGKKPSPEYSIDRIDNDGDYCPENCRWATKKEQSSNTCRNALFIATSPIGRRFTSKNQREFSAKYGLDYRNVNAVLKGHRRSHYGWTFQYIT